MGQYSGAHTRVEVERSCFDEKKQHDERQPSDPDLLRREVERGKFYDGRLGNLLDSPLAVRCARPYAPAATPEGVEIKGAGRTRRRSVRLGSPHLTSTKG